MNENAICYISVCAPLVTHRCLGDIQVLTICLLTSLEWQLHKQLQFSDANPPNPPLEYCIQCLLCIPNKRSPLGLDLGGHTVDPLRPIHRWGKQTSKWSLNMYYKVRGSSVLLENISVRYNFAAYTFTLIMELLNCLDWLLSLSSRAVISLQ